MFPTLVIFPSDYLKPNTGQAVKPSHGINSKPFLIACLLIEKGVKTMKITQYTKKDGSIVYRSSIYLGIDQITGKKIKTTISARTKKEIKSKAIQAKVEFEKNGSTRKQRTTISTYSELVELFWRTYQHTVKTNTRLKVKGCLNNHLLPSFGSYKLDKLTPVIIQTQVNKWADKYNQDGTGYKEYNNLHALNKRILQYGVSIQALESNPARDVIIPRKIVRDKHVIKYFQDEELKKFLTYLDKLENTFVNFYDTVLYKTLLATGLRIRECLALEWSDIDLQNGTININKTLNILNQVNSPKTKSSYRVLDIDHKTVLMLRLYRARQAENGRKIGLTYEKVFPNSFDNYINTRKVDYRLHNHLKNANCIDLGFHAFRHTHASILLNSGLPYKEIQTRLGHAKISVTMDTYSHLSKENQKRAVSVYETALEKIKSS